jgi:hypothetical protein
VVWPFCVAGAEAGVDNIKRRPQEMMGGNMKMRNKLLIKANSDISQPLSPWLKSNAAVAYICMRSGAYPVAS